MSATVFSLRTRSVEGSRCVHGERTSKVHRTKRFLVKSLTTRMGTNFAVYPLIVAANPYQSELTQLGKTTMTSRSLCLNDCFSPIELCREAF